MRCEHSIPDYTQATVLRMHRAVKSAEVIRERMLASVRYLERER